MYLDWSLTVLAVRWPNEQVKVLGVLYSVVHLLRGQIMVVVYKSLAEQLGLVTLDSLVNSHLSKILPQLVAQ